MEGRTDGRMDGWMACADYYASCKRGSVNRRAVDLARCSQLHLGWMRFKKLFVHQGQVGP